VQSLSLVDQTTLVTVAGKPAHNIVTYGGSGAVVIWTR